jgi:hypothetical protein
VSNHQRLRSLCAEFDLEVPSDAVVLAILDAAQQVQLLYHQAAAYGPDTLDTELIWAQFVLWTLTPPSSRYMVLLDEEPSQPLAAAGYGRCPPTPAGSGRRREAA